MQSYFYDLADFIQSSLEGKEIFTAAFGAEDSSFVRFNKNTVRQAGNVSQREISFDLIRGQKHARAGVTLSGNKDEDQRRIGDEIENLRATIPHLPDDPHLLVSEENKSSEHHGNNKLPSQSEPVASILKTASGKDLVGLYAAGGMYSGFASSFGQRNWFSTYSFNLDWSVYHHEDKAVKSGYAGFEWNDEELTRTMASSDRQLAALARPPRTVAPGRYRVYLSPVAVYDLVGTLAWGGFGLKDHRTKQSTLIKMVEDDARLSPAVTITENTAEGVAPSFQSAGFIKPSQVSLIKGGCFDSCLTSPRSAKEYGVGTNAASTWEMPESIDMAPGKLAPDDVMKELGTGLLINNVHYLNYSDRPACRITGMTRFATFWVEDGQITAPVNVMRFDETIYRMLGTNLVDLTTERDFIIDPETYGGRSNSSGRLPGALIDEFTLTL